MLGRLSIDEAQLHMAINAPGGLIFLKYFVGSILVCASVAACGGGSTDNNTAPTTQTVVTNSAPTVSAANSDQSGARGYDFSYDATVNGAVFSDTDGDALSYTVSFAPDAQGLTAVGGTITGAPTVAGDIAVTVTASDGNGGSVADTFTIAVGVNQTALQAALNGAIDLEALDDYAGQTVPDYITKLNEGGNPITNAGAALGRVLFYDVALSIDNTLSCASCHAQFKGFSDVATVSTGVQGGLTGRHSMRLVNTQFADEVQFFWDERAASHEAQETQPIMDHNELGFSGQGGRPDFDALLAKLEALDYYEELFRFVYFDAEITEARLQEALAQFTKSIHSFDAKYDAGRAQVNNNNADFPNFTAAENAGKTVFMDNNAGACATCHRPPEFDIAPNSDQNGVIGVAGDPLTFDLTNTRAPTLRDVVDPAGVPNGPFMHDGSLTTLRAVIDHYNAIATPASEPPRTEFLQTLDNRLKTGNGAASVPQTLNLTETQKQNLETFILTLTGTAIYTDAKLSDPFP